MTDLPRLNRALQGRYVVERQLGEGGMATVWLAFEEKHDRHVALKVLRPEVASAVGPDRFLKEIRVTAGLAHPHILPLYDSDVAGDVIYYAMPYVEGETLAARLARHGPLPIDEAIAITREVASALTYAHGRGIVHRDVKPANILFEAGHAVVTDFGVAHVIDDAMATRLTSTGFSIGTPLYMAPEQAVGGAAVTARSDVYSLACVLYEMLAGEPPYTGPTPRMVTIKRMTDPIPSVRRLRESVSPEVDAAITRALQKDPADRFDTPDAFAAALAAEPAAARVPSPAAGPAPVAEEIGAGAPAAAASAAHAPARRSGRAAGALGAAVVVVGVVAWAVSSGDPAPEPLAPPSFEQVTRRSGPELFPSLARDGRRVAYAGGGDIYVRDLQDGSELRLTDGGRFPSTQPSFSPDGGRIAFRSERNGGGIFVVDAGGGDARRVVNSGYNPAWSPDGGHILFASEGVIEPSTRRTLSNLFTVDVETGIQTRVSDMDAVQPSWSPDGSRIAFWSVMRDGRLTSQRDIWTMRADGSGLAAITDDAAVDWNPVWSADGRRLYFSSDRGGSMNIWTVALDPPTGAPLGVPTQVTTGGTASREHVTVSADGSRALYVERTTTSNVYRVRVDAETGALVGEPEAVTDGTWMAVEPSVSPDGTEVAFYTLGDDLDVWIARTDGSGARRLTDGTANHRSPQWSPAGDRIVFHADRSGSYQIWAAAPDGSVLEQLTRSGVITIYPFWSPDGERVGYVELQRGVALVDADDAGAGSEMLIPGDLMVRPQWSPDGTRIAGTLPPAAGGTGIVLYDVATRGLETVSEFGDAPQWLADGRRLVFVQADRLYLADLDTRDVRELRSFAPDMVGLGSVSRDGRWIYFSRSITEADLWSMEWTR